MPALPNLTVIAPCHGLFDGIFTTLLHETTQIFPDSPLKSDLRIETVRITFNNPQDPDLFLTQPKDFRSCKANISGRVQLAPIYYVRSLVGFWRRWPFPHLVYWFNVAIIVVEMYVDDLPVIKVFQEDSEDIRIEYCKGWSQGADGESSDHV